VSPSWPPFQDPPPLFPKCWDYRCMPPCLALSLNFYLFACILILGIELSNGFSGDPLKDIPIQNLWIWLVYCLENNLCNIIIKTLRWDDPGLTGQP
jgi:hypothetical protein